MKKRYLRDVLLTTIGFGALIGFGSNPYTYFVFVLCLFFGNPIARRVGKTKLEPLKEIVRGGQVVAFLAAVFIAAWLLGEENSNKVITDYRFLGSCWFWIQMILIESHYVSETGTTPQPDSDRGRLGADILPEK